MHILIMGGFLGSGKTSIIKLLIRGLVNAGQTCAIIENEIGEVGIDDAIISEAGLSITPLFGGCVCCQVSGNLFAAIERIHDEIAPDWVIIEMTGLAMMDNIRDLFIRYNKLNVDVHTVSLVDMSRWKHLLTALAIIFDRQIAGADILFLNKTDVQEPTEAVYATLREKAPEAVILNLTPEIKEPDMLWQKFNSCLSQHKAKQKL